MSNFRPMKGSVAPIDLTQLRYPLIASEKIDGWRCLVCDISWAHANIPIEAKHDHYYAGAKSTIALSASLKPIPNYHVQQQLDNPRLAGHDGELIASTSFNETSSAFATHSGSPAFAFHIFDKFDQPHKTFEQRMADLSNDRLPRSGDSTEFHIHPQYAVDSHDSLLDFLENSLPPTAEGAITRDPIAPYKFGRATPRQQWMLKIKPFEDAEAVVVGVEELMHNEGSPETNQLGLQQRGHYKVDQVPGGKLGALRCQKLFKPPTPIDTSYGGLCLDDSPSFKIGTGFTDHDRHLLWAQRADLPGRIVKYKSMKHGALNAPRHPVFLGFRAEDFSC